MSEITGAPGAPGAPEGVGAIPGAGNPLGATAATPPGASPDSAPGAMPPADWKHQSTLDTTMDQAKARFDTTGKALAKMRMYEERLQELTTKGDALTSEDVIDAAGKLVGRGEDPKQIATLMADMPAGGEALQQWVQSFLGQLEETLPQVEQAHQATRHQTGVAALHALVGHALGGGVAPQGGQPAAVPASASAPASAPVPTPAP